MCLELLAAMQELKRVMKSERAGRLARDSAEILVGDRPGEFMVITQEGSSIPVDVRDLAESASLKMDPSGDSGAAVTEPKASDASAHRAAEQPASASAEAAAPAAADPSQQPKQPVPEQPASAVRRTTWLGSMMAAGTAALGLKGGSPGDAGSAVAAQSAARSIPQQAALTGPTAESAAPTAGPPAAAAGKQAEPPVLDIAHADPKAELSPVSAFASEVAVQPVSAATTDSSPIQGKQLLVAPSDMQPGSCACWGHVRDDRVHA